MGQRETDKRRITLELSEELLKAIDAAKAQLGFRSRGPAVEQLLREVLEPQEEDDDNTDASIPLDRGDTSDSSTDDSESRAIVLIQSELVSLRDQSRDSDEISEEDYGLGSGPSRQRAKAGIQLPGFVRQQAREVQRSLKAEPRRDPGDQGLELLASSQLLEALSAAQQHWQEVYGQAPSDAVTEAAMVWLARDIWPQCDPSDGRPFSWNLAQQVVCSFCPSWPDGDPSLERIVVAAGVLEDPFSGASLSLRIPNLITRFVQRHRSRQKRTMSFEAIDHTMTVHAALRLLHLSTVADRPYSLKDIREAYREQAQCHHPDAGGSAEAMRRLNEAYQFLKERYRRAA
ncbi:MAG: hypothetical protein RLZZ533_984 [Cyanobacteriota bacterium]